MDKKKKNGIQRLLSALFRSNDRKTKPSQESTILVARAGQLGFAHRVGHDTTPPAKYKMCIALVGPQDNPVIHDILIQQGWLVYNYATNTSYVHELLHEVLQCMGATPGQIDYIGKISFQGCKEMELKGYSTRAYLVRQEEHLLNHNPLKEIMPFRKGEKAWLRHHSMCIYGPSPCDENRDCPVHRPYGMTFGVSLSEVRHQRGSE